MDLISEAIQNWGVTKVILLGILVFGIASFGVVHASGPSFDTENYNSFRVAWPSILILWTGSAIALGWLIRMLPPQFTPQLEAEALADPSKMLFLVYLIGFMSMWAVYFASKSPNRFLKVKTLRSFLSLYSAQFTGGSKGPVTEQEAQLKAGTSATAIAFMVAVSVVVLNLVNDTSLELKGANAFTLWPQFMMGIAAACAIISFYSFLVAADILETIFNKFDDAVRHQVTARLYKSSTNPKYYGLVLLMASVAFFVAAREPALGALCFAVASFIGYCHWFPSSVEAKGSGTVEWLIRIAIVVFPIALSLHAFHS